MNLINFNNKTFIQIPEFTDSYYKIPKDKGGKIIDNLDKKSLHLSYYNDELSAQTLEIEEDLKFSIQLFSNDKYEVVKNKFESLIQSNEKIFLKKDLYIINFINNLKNEYFLLFKNFAS